FREKAGERPHGRRLAGAFLASDEHAADRRVDRIQDERELHLVLTDDGAERVDESFHQAEPVLSISRWTLSTIELCERSNSPKNRPPRRSARSPHTLKAYAP